ncbi:hypothetical protein LWC34_54515 [Kibdelosporangium philippinense]|uniref:Uncharacterized protein n=1 Tax=Kibdelosporangium philippinense TaxID=211113 RepID=A0ABS8ZWV6_9PSEU|nr:hypothetical protein [Kibdelosporangium philippinense]MCE7011773.1 hypothetical protein [Kibdelosporangium philippinense]
MSTLTSLARAHAVELGRAQPIATVRHVHVSQRPLVCVPLAMAGEANAPLAVLVGRDRDAPRLLIVAQPRNRELRFDFAHSLALTVLGYIGSFASTMVASSRPGGGSKPRVADAPQVWVPNRAGIDFLRLFGRSTRFRSTTGPYAVPVSVPSLGRWLTFLAERAEYPGSSLLVAATDVLAEHWATGQSAVEDGNLASLLGWIAPPPGSDGAQAALAAEDPLVCPPAGPATDTTFDREVLEPGIAEYDRASADPERRRRAVTRLETALRGQLEPTWRLMWQAIDQLRALPPGEHVATRWDLDKDAYLRFHTHVATGGHPQPKRDSAVAAAMRLNQLERHQAEYDAQRAFDDPLVMAEYRLAGDAFVGVVTSAVPNRRVGAGRSAVLRPLITVSTQDPVRLVPGDGPVTDRARPRQRAEIVSVTETAGGLEITLELAGGMGRGRTAPAGTMPAVGDQVCFSILTDDYQPRGTFPARENTPWTHGGPPALPVPTGDDAKEEWS